MTSVRVWTFLVLVSLAFRSGMCKKISEANFSSPAIVEQLEWGIRSASSRCSFSFPSITVYAGSAFILTRFDVRVLNLTHDLGLDPDSVTTGPSFQWLLVRSDLTFSSYFDFDFQYTYGDYLGKEGPTGDCTLFTNRSEAWAYASATPDLTINEKDRLISSSTPQMVYLEPGTNETWVVALCEFAFSGNLTKYEGHTYMKFGIPVSNVSSFNSTALVAEDKSAGWYLGRVSNPLMSSLTALYGFTVSNDNLQALNDSYCCSLYAVTNETIPGIISTLACTTPIVVTYVIQENFTHSGERRIMQENENMRDKAVCNVTTLWTMDATNQLACGRRCLEDVDCLSVFYMAVDKSCYAHVNVFTKGDCNSTLTSYYVIV